jgi:hypothetical protein
VYSLLLMFAVLVAGKVKDLIVLPDSDNEDEEDIAGHDIQIYFRKSKSLPKNEVPKAPLQAAANRSTAQTSAAGSKLPANDNLGVGKENQEPNVELRPDPGKPSNVERPGLKRKVAEVASDSETEDEGSEDGIVSAPVTDAEDDQ